MPIYVDTSALYALMDAAEARHPEAMSIWTQLHDAREPLVTSNYVTVETGALVSRRLGPEARRDFHSLVVPALIVVWIDAPLHARGVAALLAANQRDLSLVDCVSFEVMRDRSIYTAFAFDRHFIQYGFSTAGQLHP